ncbi:MAG: GntR family transcriptional regulator [Nocardioidaceae bacterium]
MQRGDERPSDQPVPEEVFAAQLGPLQRPRPLRHQVQDALVELIISRVLTPGQHLVETDLARRLQVSRQPVREALQALHGDGWVDLRPGMGAFVHAPTEEEVDAVFAVRPVLESESARLAARNATPEVVKDLRGLCRVGRTALASGDDVGVVTANAALHRQVTALAANSALSRIIDSLDRQIRWYFTPIVRTRGQGSWDEHDQLIDALSRHDETAASDVMRTHTERSRNTYRQMRAEQRQQE